jgi:HEPN domain-containing protein/predicted nucleotidyltransferase
MKKNPPINTISGRRPITMPLIRRLARQIAEKFRPQRIILFGSFAYGQPGPDSDVDILVVMPARNEFRQACRIRHETDHPFPLDLVVRAPKNMKWRPKEGDWFLREIVGKGKVLYEKTNSRWVQKAEEDMAAARRLSKGKPVLNGAVCFHCQQAVEKYFKVLLQETGLPIPYIHDLVDLRKKASIHDSRSSLKLAEKVRQEIRIRLGLKPKRRSR